MRKKLPVIFIRTSKRCSGSGADGVYYKLSRNIGVKVFNKRILNPLKPGRAQVRAIRREMALQKLAWQHGLAPNSYALVLVKDQTGRYRLGHVQEHIPGRTLFRALEDTYEETWKMRDALYSIGINQIDSHDMNIMRYRSKNYAIDFTRAKKFKVRPALTTDQKPPQQEGA